MTTTHTTIHSLDRTCDGCDTRIVAQHTIPGTSRTVTIERRPGLKPKTEVFIVTREGDLGNGFNYLSCGRPTEAEAREAANFLWTDARDRAHARQAG